MGPYVRTYVGPCDLGPDWLIRGHFWLKHHQAAPLLAHGCTGFVAFPCATAHCMTAPSAPNSHANPGGTGAQPTNAAGKAAGNAARAGGAGAQPTPASQAAWSGGTGATGAQPTKASPNERARRRSRSPSLLRGRTRGKEEVDALAQIAAPLSPRSSSVESMAEIGRIVAAARARETSPSPPITPRSSSVESMAAIGRILASARARETSPSPPITPRSSSVESMAEIGRILASARARETSPSPPITPRSCLVECITGIERIVASARARQTTNQLRRLTLRRSASGAQATALETATAGAQPTDLAEAEAASLITRPPTPPRAASDRDLATAASGASGSQQNAIGAQPAQTETATGSMGETATSHTETSETGLAQTGMPETGESAACSPSSAVDEAIRWSPTAHGSKQDLFAHSPGAVRRRCFWTDSAAQETGEVYCDLCNQWLNSRAQYDRHRLLRPHKERLLRARLGE